MTPTRRSCVGSLGTRPTRVALCGGRRDHQGDRLVTHVFFICASCDAAHISWKGAGTTGDKKPAWRRSDQCGVQYALLCR